MIAPRANPSVEVGDSVARFMSAPARRAGPPRLRLVRAARADAAPTLRIVTPPGFIARPAPADVPSLSFPFLGDWFLSRGAETTNASKEGKETT